MIAVQLISGQYERHLLRSSHNRYSITQIPQLRLGVGEKTTHGCSLRRRAGIAALKLMTLK